MMVQRNIFYFTAKTQAKIPKQMRTFEDSQKSKKTVASMIERKGEEKGKKSGKALIIKFLLSLFVKLGRGRFLVYLSLLYNIAIL